MHFRMDWSVESFDWNRARGFLAVAEEGSSSAAARALHLAQPTLGRKISALEEELGVALFERAGRGLMLTPAGLELVAHVRRMGDAAIAMSLAATGRSEDLDGEVCITASGVWAAYVLAPIVTALRERHPGVRIEILASNAISDLRRREADIAVRSVVPSDPALIGRKLGEAKAALYAPPRYLNAVAPLERPEDFARCAFVGFRENRDVQDGLRARGLPVSEANFPVPCANHLVQWRLVKAGAGVGVMLTDVGDRDEDVRRAADWFESFIFPVWFVAHRGLRASRRIRLVFDALAQAIGEQTGGAVILIVRRQSFRLHPS